ncbi:MAG: TolC family protein, partial [Planctomycetales bacterium]
ELRRQRWVIRRRELELIAAGNFLLPRLDASGLYRWRGFGDDLIDPNGPGGVDNAFQNLTEGQLEEWQLGLQLSVPIGFRKGHAGVRNAELNLTRARAIYREQERTIVHSLAGITREMDLAYHLAQTQYNLLVAAKINYEALQQRYDVGVLQANQDSLTLLIQVLESRQSLSQAELRFHQILAGYAVAIKNAHWQKGTLLSFNGIRLAEGAWPSQAYADARRVTHYLAPTHLDYGFVKPCNVACAPYRQILHYERPDSGEANGSQAVPLEPTPAPPVAPPVPILDLPPAAEGVGGYSPLLQDPYY